MEQLFAGIDLGTSGCRIMVIDADDTVHASDSILYSNADVQSPLLWWRSVQSLLKNLPKNIKSSLQSIAIDGTSGSVLWVDDQGKPLTSALMYNDLRATDEATLIASTLPSDNGGQGASGSLARVLWLIKHELEKGKKQGGWRNKSHITHQADYILGKLSNNFALSDENNCLKLGYDVINQCWPVALEKLGITNSQLPRVYPAGTAVAKISTEQAQTLELPKKITLVTGTTDSISAFIATGADKTGDAVTSLGSTLVLKLISDKPIFSSEHGIYSHRFSSQNTPPRWLVGGASNSGAKVLQHFFTQKQIDAMTLQLSPNQPTNLNYYPLVETGERFPIADSKKIPMLLPRPESDQSFFQGILEGIANIEAQGYRKLIDLGTPKITSVRSVGGGSKNQAWSEIRANHLREISQEITMIKPKHNEAAYGAALLAKRGVKESS